MAALQGHGGVGVVAISYAVGLAVLASDLPDIRDQIRFLVSIGGYRDTRAVVTFITTGAYHDPTNGTRLDWPSLSDSVIRLPPRIPWPKMEMTAPATGAPRVLSTHPTSPPPSSARAVGVARRARTATGTTRRPKLKWTVLWRRNP